MRIRSKPIVTRYFGRNAVSEFDITWSSICETFIESSYPGSNQCKHWFIKPPEGNFPWQLDMQGNRTYVNGLVEELNDARAMTQIMLRRPFLQWDKLPTSTKFGLIQLIAELDDSLSLFTKKFWKALSYGSFSWGVLPFISELTSLIESVKRLFLDLDGFEPYEHSVEFTDVQQLLGVGSQAYQLFGTWRHTGKVVFDITELNAFLDFVGFHPDLSTAWDLVPLSFLVDYLMPVGSFLDGLSNRGWVSSLRFVGWETLKYQARYGYFLRGPEHNNLFSCHQPNVLYTEYFQRNYLDCVLQVDRSSDVSDYELPSLTELINLLYVFVLQRHGFSR